MNEDAEKALDAYLDATHLAVPHAILVEGPWGSGKTHFLDKVYRPKRANRLIRASKPHTPLLIVSLFGAMSAADAQLRIYKAANPAEAFIGGVFGAVALAVGEFFQVGDTSKTVVDKVGRKAVTQLNDFIIVLDDLERIEPKAFGEIMGLVNSYVAEQGRRVILVTDETKLKQLQGENFWKEQNEKIIGRRVRIRADVESVVRNSIANVTDARTRAFMSDRVEELIEVARQSKVENLRSLSWALHNATHFVACLHSDADIPADHIARTMKIVAAVTLWYRAGLLDEAVLDRLPRLSIHLMSHRIAHGDAQTEEPEAIRAQDFMRTFATLDVDSPPVDYALIAAFERNGVLDQGALITWVKSQFGFGRQHKEPTWRQLWHSYERPISDTDLALKELAVELRDRKYTKRGEILHVAGLAIRFRNNGYTKLTDDEDVVSYFKAYIDDLFALGTLETRKRDALPIEFDAFGSLGYSSIETPEFQEIHSHLSLRQQEIGNVALHDKVETIIGDAEAGNLEALFALVQLDNPELSSNPVMMDFDVQRLVSLFTKDMPALNAGSRMLSYRYGNAYQDSDLLNEIPWTRQVYAAMIETLETWLEPHRSTALNSLTGIVKHYDNERIPEARIVPDVHACELARGLNADRRAKPLKSL